MLVGRLAHLKYEFLVPKWRQLPKYRQAPEFLRGENAREKKVHLVAIKVCGGCVLAIGSVLGGADLRGGVGGLVEYAVALRGRVLFAAWLRALASAHGHI
jgi:hypothetical protein